MLQINGMPDHIHFLIGMKPSCCLSGLVREIKKSSTDFIREKNFIKSKFQWQEGFGAFSYGHSSLDDVIGYIQLQKEHHRKLSFKEEYIPFKIDLILNLRMNICFSGLNDMIWLSHATTFGVGKTDWMIFYKHATPFRGRLSYYDMLILQNKSIKRCQPEILNSLT